MRGTKKKIKVVPKYHPDITTEFEKEGLHPKFKKGMVVLPQAEIDALYNQQMDELVERRLTTRKKHGLKRQVLYCENCGKEFVRYVYGKKQRCCSQACWSALHRTTIRCDYCGKEFSVVQSGAKHRKYCSQQCAVKSRLVAMSL